MVATGETCSNASPTRPMSRRTHAGNTWRCRSVSRMCSATRSRPPAGKSSAHLLSSRRLGTTTGRRSPDGARCANCGVNRTITRHRRGWATDRFRYGNPIETSFPRFQKLLRFVVRPDPQVRLRVKICFAVLPIGTALAQNRTNRRVSCRLGHSLHTSFDVPRWWNQMFHQVVSGHVIGVHPRGSSGGYEIVGVIM